MSHRIRLFGFEIDALTMSAAVDRIYVWIDSRELACRFVVTPNVDHAVLFQHNSALRDAYGRAALVLADGMPVVVASRLLGRPVPERVAGSDLAPALFDAAPQHGPVRVYLLGTAPGVAKRAAAKIDQRWPAVRVVGTYSPPIGFEHDAAENAKILAKISAAKPDLLLVGLGAPKQELWVDAHRHAISATVTLCVGATIDFLAGERQRAPLWMRRRRARVAAPRGRRTASSAWSLRPRRLGLSATPLARMVARGSHPALDSIGRKGT